MLESSYFLAYSVDGMECSANEAGRRLFVLISLCSFSVCSIVPNVMSGVKWQTHLQMAQHNLSRMKEPSAIFQFALSHHEDQDNVPFLLYSVLLYSINCVNRKLNISTWSLVMKNCWSSTTSWKQSSHSSTRFHTATANAIDRRRNTYLHVLSC